MLREENTYPSRLIKAIVVIFFYLTVSFCIGYIADDLGITGLTNRAIFSLFCEFTLVAIIIYVYRKDIIPMFNDFKQNKKEYIRKYLKYWFLILILMFTSNIIITQFTTNEVATNQEIIDKAFELIPVYILISTIIISPIIEELIFRFCIREIIPKPNIIYIIISGLLFGSMHVVFTLTNVTDLLFIIPYSIPGIIFAYLYCKTKNIFIPISLHFIHNGVLMLLEVLVSLI